MCCVESLPEACCNVRSMGDLQRQPARSSLRLHLLAMAMLYVIFAALALGFLLRKDPGSGPKWMTVVALVCAGCAAAVEVVAHTSPRLTPSHRVAGRASAFAWSWGALMLAQCWNEFDKSDFASAALYAFCFVVVVAAAVILLRLPRRAAGECQLVT